MSSSTLELLKSSEKITEWFDNNYQGLKKYDGQFIDIYRKTVVDYDVDYRNLADRIKKSKKRELGDHNFLLIDQFVICKVGQQNEANR
jgi:hypothetical protein